MPTALVAIENTVYSIDILYSYLIPDDLIALCKKGCRVVVPFGRGNIPRVGVVLDIENDDKNGLKSIISVADKTPILNNEMLKTVAFLKDRTFCTYFDAVKAIIPFGLNIKLEEYLTVNNNYDGELSADEQFAVNILKDGKLSPISFCDKCGINIDTAFYKSLFRKKILLKDYSFAQKMEDFFLKTVTFNDIEKPKRLTVNQNKAYEYIKEKQTTTLKDVTDNTGVAIQTVRTLENKGVISVSDVPYYRSAVNNLVKKDVHITLTDEQETVYKGLLKELKSKKPQTSLLYGVTGSGKTSVYIKLVDYVLSKNKTAIVMVPEIALTPQTLSLFYSKYGDDVAVFHSSLSNGQRMDQFKKAKEGLVKVAIGTRSAIFAPLKNLGLIIIDEEQEHTYKSDQSPHFHTKDVALFRASYNNALLLLSSATPSFDSFAKAKSGAYRLFELKNRYGNAVLPTVDTVDMKKEYQSGSRGVFCRQLLQDIETTLKNKKQVILLLNRRGHNTYISCPKCGYVYSCDNCSISLTYHSDRQKLICHYCGCEKDVPTVCPECGNEVIKYSGYGTQKAVEELNAVFPSAKILRLDADSTIKKDSFSINLNAFANHKYDIMVGTQMVAKGLDFPDVTLVGVLCADNALYFDDYRAFERSFSLITQVVGRSGRGDNEGRAVIQTNDPDNFVIEMARRQDYDSFNDTEIKTRKLMIYPPYCDLVMLAFTADSKSAASTAADKMMAILKEQSLQSPDVKMIVLR
ncbi:MAG: primosomal protein N', partial [Oscillospiraceae bacterium]|nr:primosomal protein N' [Candidatus Equicaccousia limihippi]